MLIKLPTQKSLTQFLKAAGITHPSWSQWVRKGVAPKHRRVPDGRRHRIVIEQADWDRWFGQLEADRQQTGKPWLRHPLPPAGSEPNRPFDEAVAVAIEASRARATAEIIVRGLCEAAERGHLDLSDRQILAMSAKFAERLMEGDDTEEIVAQLASAITQLEVAARRERSQ